MKTKTVGMTNFNFKLIGGVVDGEILGFYEGNRLVKQLMYPFPVKSKDLIDGLIYGVRLNEGHNLIRCLLPSSPHKLTEPMIFRFIAHYTLEATFPKDMRQDKVVSFNQPASQEDAFLNFVSVHGENNIFFVMDYDEAEALVCIEVDPVKNKSYRLVYLNRSQTTMTNWDYLDNNYI